MSRDDFSPFGANDPLREMRNRINRDREALFHGEIPGGPRRAQENPFFREAAGFCEFPTSSAGFRSPFEMSGFPTDFNDGFRHGSFPQSNGSPRQSTDQPSSDTQIPIRVIHDRTCHSPSQGKHRFTGRNTTEIPAARNSQLQPETPNTDRSPRLERAHSEPPKLFNQRLRSGGATSPAPHNYSTIPENSESSFSGNRYSPRPEPEIPSHKLSGSASAPSVPDSDSPPQPPPRRAKAEHQQQQEKEEKSSTQPEVPRVRHIPIFVEGRDEPIVNRKSSQGEAPPPQWQGGFKQPSDFYPQNTEKVRNQSGSGSASSGRGGLHLKPQVPNTGKTQEPTSPLSPPPSDQPIPMGCSEYLTHPQKAPEPPSPAVGTSDEPIPMPYHQHQADGHSEEVHVVPVRVVNGPEEAKTDQKVEQPSAGPKPLSPAEVKLKKIESEVSDLLGRVEKFSGSKKDREYLFLDDMLTQKLCLLDSIETDGRADIRQMRKDSIKSINRCLSMLDRRATGGDQTSKPEEPYEKSASDQVSNEVLSELAKDDSSVTEDQAQTPKKIE